MGTALLTDLYELTMAQSYLEQERTGNAVFSLFCRTLPDTRNFLVACGLELLLRQIEDFRFGSDEITYLSGLNIFSDAFLDYLRVYRFSGSLSAIPEGTIVFRNEPLVQIEGSLPEVQILETIALNSIQYQTMAASKAARIVSVAGDKTVVDFGFRRAHMTDAGIAAARAGYIAGFAGTSNCEAGKRFGIPVVGTMAHSYVMVFTRQEDAFRAFATTFPDRALFLIDTYDTISCAGKVAALANEGVPVTGVRIDSGDIPALVPAVRKTLDDANLQAVKIFVSSGVDEYAIDSWLKADIPIDSFGVGTHFITSSDAPFLDMVYKLVEYEGRPVFKSSPGKTTFPCRRQVIREYRDGLMACDRVVRNDRRADVQGLLQDFICEGKPTATLPSVEEIRGRLRSGLAELPPSLKKLKKGDYQVIVEP
jgi:nicotinate phosphoribosyltransferase